MVSLDGILEKRVEQQTMSLINWHRNTQLIQYADLLRGLKRDFGLDLTEEQVSHTIVTIESLWQLLAEKLNEEMVVLLPLLNNSQLEELFVSINKKNDKFYKENVDLDKDEIAEEFKERLLDNFESWLGDLTKQQKNEIQKTATMIYSSAHLRLKLRKYWQENIQEILKAEDTIEVKSDQLNIFFNQFNVERINILADIRNKNIQAIGLLTVKLIHIATPDQKQHFTNKADDYIQIFTELKENR
ncbi:MAG: DUF6279 family lipoprotein [Candidatus Thioglobus sp.]|jgi:hypothetical protein|uniref:DUF6279 family lipoprotein n=1 Tax=Candidatus Thioglobus sp. TaxID=2026721 RepID=UPI0030AC11F6